jgi:carbon-monoxide dehydrogenase small subunit
VTTYRLTVNGAPAEVDAPGMRRLLDSCLVPVCQVDGADVRTVEGLAAPAADAGEPVALDPLQAAFLITGGAQCGICTPGMLLAGRAYLDAGGTSDEEAIREAIAGNLCRCTGYTKIVDAIALVAGAGR